MSSPVIHRKKFMDGRMTPAEVHAELVFWKRKCGGCGGVPSTRIQVFVLLSDMSVSVREAVLIEVAMGRVHTVPKRGGPAVRVSDVASCASCSPSAERAAAGGPSYAIVEIETFRGEGVLVAVPGAQA